MLSGGSASPRPVGGSSSHKDADRGSAASSATSALPGGSAGGTGAGGVGGAAKKKGERKGGANSDGSALGATADHLLLLLGLPASCNDQCLQRHFCDCAPLQVQMLSDWGTGQARPAACLALGSAAAVRRATAETHRVIGGVNIRVCGVAESESSEGAPGHPSQASHPIPSHPIPSHPITSHPIPSHPIPSHPIASHHITSHPITPRPAPPHPAKVNCPTPSHSISPRPTPSHTQPHTPPHTSSSHTLPHPMQTIFLHPCQLR